MKYGIDFTEAMADSHYTGTVKTAVDTLNTQAKEFFGITDGHAYGERVVNSGETVMDIMHKFAVKYSYTSEVPEGCTYMATLNGIGEFTLGSTPAGCIPMVPLGSMVRLTLPSGTLPLWVAPAIL